ncbi:MAG: phytoene/squalene synthase family protein [Bacteroidales bacterium]
MIKLYHKSAFKISRLITKSYSTSFSFATSLFEKEMREAIYSIYGFVRFADEIVDTFHGYDKNYLLDKFEKDYYEAFNHGISLNPILHSFQITVKKYNISDEHIRAFLNSMKFDLEKKEYTTKREADQYIYGSADVVGLMCLKVFCNGNEQLYASLVKPAMKLGSAFQKVNFLRDLKHDTQMLDRRYFPEVSAKSLDDESKDVIIRDIENDFRLAYQGIKQLPGRSKLAVLLAYYYYRILLNKIKCSPASKVMESRIRISNAQKMGLLLKAVFVYNLKME